MTKIAIGVAHHKESPLIQNDCLLPIQVGKACVDFDLNMQGDDTGDNISSKNFGYAEMTAMYWLWKNSDADIKGLFHYRRFLDLNPKSVYQEKKIYEWPLDPNFSSKKLLEQLAINKENITRLITEYPIITRKKEDLRVWTNRTVRKHYADEHFIDHLDQALAIIQKDYPDYYDTAIRIIDGYESYFTNLVVMHKDEFDQYCAWIFDILFKIESTINLYEARFAPGTANARWAGFLSERLSSIYLQKQLEGGKRVGEFPAVILVPRVDRKWYEYITYGTSNYASKQGGSVTIPNAENPAKPVVSLVIPAYNAKKYIKKCLLSASSQTLQNIEIIVVDDGSTDDTLNIIKQLATKDARIQVVTQPNGGPGAARNRALGVAQGEFISFMDADDYMDETCLENMVKNAKRYNSEIVLATYRLVSEHSERLLTTSPLPHTLINPSSPQSKLNIHTNVDLMLVPCNLWDKIFKRTLLDGLKFLEHGGEDIFFWYSALFKAGQISVHRSCEYNYRIVNGSVESNLSYAQEVWKSVALTQKLVEAEHDQEISELFNVSKDLIFSCQLWRCKDHLCDEDFKLMFYKIATSLREGQMPLSPITLKKRMWFRDDFVLLEKIKNCKDLGEMEKIAIFNDPLHLLGQLLKCKIREILVSRKHHLKYRAQIDEIKAKLRYPIKYRLLGLTVFKIKRDGEKYTFKLLGLPIFKRKLREFTESFYFLGLPIFSKNPLRTKLLGITVRDKTDAYLLHKFGEL